MAYTCLKVKFFTLCLIKWILVLMRTTVRGYKWNIALNKETHLICFVEMSKAVLCDEIILDWIKERYKKWKHFFFPFSAKRFIVHRHYVDSFNKVH